MLAAWIYTYKVGIRYPMLEWSPAIFELHIIHFEITQIRSVQSHSIRASQHSYNISQAKKNKALYEYSELSSKRYTSMVLLGSLPC